MKRNMDLVRNILLQAEANKHGTMYEEIAVEGFSDEEIGHHIYLLGQAELAEVDDTTHRGCDSYTAQLRCLTWKGHEFVEAARDDTNWNKAKEVCTRGGRSLSFEALKVALGAIVATGIKIAAGL